MTPTLEELRNLRAVLAETYGSTPTEIEQLELAAVDLAIECREGAVYGSEVLCPSCATAFCEHGERLHFHHDGCPACEGASTDASPAITRADTCTWTADEDGVYHAACGYAWVFESGSPSENGINFCHRCGGSVTIVEWTDPTIDEDEE